MSPPHVPCQDARPGRVRLGAALALALGRSLFPLLSLVILLGTLLWGPWISLLLALVSWRLVVRHA